MTRVPLDPTVFRVKRPQRRVLKGVIFLAVEHFDSLAGVNQEWAQSLALGALRKRKKEDVPFHNMIVGVLNGCRVWDIHFMKRMGPISPADEQVVTMPRAEDESLPE